MTPSGSTAETLPLDGRWFGDFEIPIGSSLSWRVGPLGFNVQRTRGEWRLQKDASGDAYDATLALQRHSEAEVEPLDGSIQRFLVSDDSTSLRVGVLLPDRSIVSRPSTPVSIPPGETVQFYLSYPYLVRTQHPAGVAVLCHTHPLSNGSDRVSTYSESCQHAAGGA